MNLLNIIFGTQGNWKNRHRIRNFTSKLIFINLKTQIKQIKGDFSVKEIEAICNALCINRSRTFYEIAARGISCFCDFNTLNLNVIPEDIDNNDN